MGIPYSAVFAPLPSWQVPRLRTHGDQRWPISGHGSALWRPSSLKADTENSELQQEAMVAAN